MKHYAGSGIPLAFFSKRESKCHHQCLDGYPSKLLWAGWGSQPGTVPWHRGVEPEAAAPLAVGPDQVCARCAGVQLPKSPRPGLSRGRT